MNRPSPSRRLASALSLAAVLAVVGTAPAQAADDGPAVTPYRPSVSSPAALPAPGWLEMEVGALDARGPASEERFSVPLTFKLAFTPDLGVVLGADAFVHDTVPGVQEARGMGDTTLALKQRFALDDHRAFGLELGVKVPTASSALGSGHADGTANGIYSADFADAWHVDLNASATRLGGSANRIRAWQAGWAAALSRSLGDDWGAVGELSGTHLAGAKATNQLLLAGSFNASNAAVLDAGLARGLNHDTPRLQFFVGGTFRLGRLF